MIVVGWAFASVFFSVRCLSAAECDVVDQFVSGQCESMVGASEDSRDEVAFAASLTCSHQTNVAT